MAGNMTGVVCSLSECVYFAKMPNQPRRVFCKHPEVRTNRATARCPFYRIDWQRKADEMSRLAKK